MNQTFESEAHYEFFLIDSKYHLVPVHAKGCERSLKEGCERSFATHNAFLLFCCLEAQIEIFVVGVSH